MDRFFVFIYALMAVAACSNTPEGGTDAKPDLTSDMTGKWVTLGFQVNVKTWGGAEKDSTIKVTKAEFHKYFKFKENKGNYKNDGTFEEFFYAQNDSVLLKVSGSWAAQGDTVFVQQLYPEYRETSYHLELKGDTATFTGYLDWDRDGKKDDYYQGTSLKQPAD